MLHLVGFLQPRITIHGTTNIKFMCFEFSPQLLSETFLILKRNERDMI